MSRYWHVFRLGMQETMVYRFNFFARALVGLIPLVGTLSLWRSIYEGKGNGSEVAGYGLSQMISYYLLVTLVDSLTAVAEDDWRIAADIKDGGISQFLLKPMDYFTYRLTLFFSGRLICTSMAMIPVGVFLFLEREHVVGPAGFWSGVGFVASTAMAALLQFVIAYAMALLAFWVLDVSTFIFIQFAIEYLASGHLFPLEILPRGVARALEFTPYPYLLHFPISVYLGRLEPGRVWEGFAMQAGWLVAGYGVARWVWSRGIRRYAAAGG